MSAESTRTPRAAPPSSAPQPATPFECRVGCGACCIAPSIATPFFGMPLGKRAGERCVHLTDERRCALFGRPERPQCCRDLAAAPDMCGASDEEALRILEQLERDTLP
ncbi:MAG TPA: YkgJ family cysteine cluster protein [Planctomycetota bacterium]|nr:YkgJ family cysteine cluster protein [Planctomycetota bacterium]